MVAIPGFSQAVNPSDVNSPQVTHLARNAEVIFLKRAKNQADAGSPEGTEPEVTEAQRKYREFILSGIMKRNRQLEDASPDPDTFVGLDRYTYWQVTTVSVPAGQKLNKLQQVFPNADVSVIRVNNTTKDFNTATITLRNPQLKYCFQQHPLYLGQTVFDSDDIVMVNLPGLDGKLYRAFTGYITTIRQSGTYGESINNTITLECLDNMKKMRESRTNAKPSLNAVESQGAKVSSFNISYSNMLPHEILTMIFARAYCELYSAPGYRSALETIRETAATDPVTAVVKEEELTEQYAKLPVGTPADVSAAAKSGLFIVPKGSVTGTVDANSKTPATATTASTIPGQVRQNIPKQIFGYKQARRTTIPTNDSTVSKYSPVDTRFLADDLAFIIEGTSQPVYETSFTQFSLDRWISEWKSGYSVAREIADALCFELFTTPEGVVRFRPLNILLPADVVNTNTGNLANVFPHGQKGRVGMEYWSQTKFIEAESYSDTDNNVFTLAYVLGRYQYSNLNAGLEYIRAGIVVDGLKFNKLGPRVAPQVTKLELIDDNACRSYARAYLTRLNAASKTASITYTGDARIRAGNPFYVQHKNRIYYIESMSHDFTAGDKYTITLNLNYGRDPIAISSVASALRIATSITDGSLLADVKSRYLFPAVVDRLVDQGAIDPQTLLFSTTETELERYLSEGPPPTGDSNLVFNGFVWEDIPAMTYEELFNDLNTTSAVLQLAKLMQDNRTNGQGFVEKLQQYMRSHPGLPASAAITAVLNQEAKAGINATAPQ